VTASIEGHAASITTEWRDHLRGQVRRKSRLEQCAATKAELVAKAATHRRSSALAERIKADAGD
jgi:hypothetical protein